MNDDNLEIPPNATIRKEFSRCGNPDCQDMHRPHGPYLNAYWREGKKIIHRYIGKSLEEFNDREIAKRIAKKMGYRPSQHIKFKFIKQEESRGNELAKQYLEKLRNNEVSIDWAHRVLINNIREQRDDDDHSL
jgi:hypothetical protein